MLAGSSPYRWSELGPAARSSALMRSAARNFGLLARMVSWLSLWHTGLWPDWVASPPSQPSIGKGSGCKRWSVGPLMHWLNRTEVSDTARSGLNPIGRD